MRDGAPCARGVNTAATQLPLGRLPTRVLLNHAHRRSLDLWMHLTLEACWR